MPEKCVHRKNALFVFVGICLGWGRRGTVFGGCLCRLHLGLGAHVGLELLSRATCLYPPIEKQASKNVSVAFSLFTENSESCGSKRRGKHQTTFSLHTFLTKYVNTAIRGFSSVLLFSIFSVDDGHSSTRPYHCFAISWRTLWKVFEWSVSKRFTVQLYHQTL